MLDWKKPLEHKQIIKIKLLISAPNHKDKTMGEVQGDLREAGNELLQKLEEMNEHYKHLTFEIDEEWVWGKPPLGRGRPHNQ